MSETKDAFTVTNNNKPEVTDFCAQCGDYATPVNPISLSCEECGNCFCKECCRDLKQGTSEIVCGGCDSVIWKRKFGRADPLVPAKDAKKVDE